MSWSRCLFLMMARGVAALAAACTLLNTSPCLAGWWPGFAPPPDGKGLNYYGYAVQNYNDQLVVGGFFTQAGFNTQGRYVCAWDGTRWVSLQNGTDGMVIALHALGGSLYVGGAFQHVGYAVTPANRVARWDGSNWHGVGDGFDDQVLVLGEYQGHLVAGGYFTSSGGAAMSLIAEWDGASWHGLGAGLSGGSTARVTAIAEYGGSLYVGGSFDFAGSTPVSNMARWDDTSWSPCGAVLLGAEGWGAPVEVMSTEYDGSLMVGGNTNSIGGVSCNGLAEWNGTSWLPLGLGLYPDAAVYDVTVYNGDLIAFGSVGTTSEGEGVVRWDGVTWSDLGSVLWSYDLVGGQGAVVTYGSDLYMVGNIARVGDMPSAFIARWTDAGSTDSPEIASVSPAAWSVAPLRNPIVDSAEIRFAVGQRGPVSLSILDVQGRLIARLFEGLTGPESRSVTWNGCWDAGPRVASGVYFVRLADDRGSRASAKLTVVR